MAARDEVYAKFGLTAEAAQLFETDLGTILLAFEGEQRGWHVAPDPNTAALFYEKLNKKTLGQILTALKQYADVEEDVEAMFQSALSARNALNHGFFEKHNYAIHSADGRDAMVADLEVLHDRLVVAYQVTQRISGFLVNRLITARVRRDS